MLTQQASALAFAENKYQGVLCLIPLGTLGRIMSKLRQVSWKRLGPAFAPWIHWSQDHAGKAPVTKICCHFWTVPRKISLEMSPCSPTFGIPKPCSCNTQGTHRTRQFPVGLFVGLLRPLGVATKALSFRSWMGAPQRLLLGGRDSLSAGGSWGMTPIFWSVAHHVARCYKPEIKSQGLHVSANIWQALTVSTCGLASWYHPFL